MLSNVPQHFLSLETNGIGLFILFSFLEEPKFVIVSEYRQEELGVPVQVDEQRLENGRSLARFIVNEVAEDVRVAVVISGDVSHTYETDCKEPQYLPRDRYQKILLIVIHPWLIFCLLALYIFKKVSSAKRVPLPNAIIIIILSGVLEWVPVISVRRKILKLGRRKFWRIWHLTANCTVLHCTPDRDTMFVFVSIEKKLFLLQVVSSIEP